jgi:hypothetical protein
LLVVASHNFVIVAFEAYNLCNLLVVQLFHFMNLEAFHFLLVFKLFPIENSQQQQEKIIMSFFGYYQNLPLSQ